MFKLAKSRVPGPSRAPRAILGMLAVTIASFMLAWPAFAECTGCKWSKAIGPGDDPCWILEVDVTGFNGECVWNGTECDQENRCAIYIGWKVVSTGGAGCPTSGSFGFGYLWEDGHTTGTVANDTPQQTFQRIGCGAGALVLAVTNGPYSVGGAAGFCSACAGQG